jgi:hypothetical protein
MRNLLLLGVAAYLLTRQSTTTNGGGGGGGNNGGGGGGSNGGGGNDGNGGGGTLAPLVNLILPHVKVNGKDIVVTDLPLPAGSFNKAVVCNTPGGEARVADIQLKYDRYLKEFVRYRNLTLVQKALPYNIYILNLRKKAYQNAIEFHLTQCQ